MRSVLSSSSGQGLDLQTAWALHCHGNSVQFEEFASSLPAAETRRLSDEIATTLIPDDGT